jgi:sodium-dependent dicarboxylate transporter 2/3/5
VEGATEPYEPPTPEPGAGWRYEDLRSRLWAVPLAITFATLGVLVAPDEWPSGRGTLAVEIDGRPVLDGDVAVGPADAQRTQTLRSRSPAGTVEAALPGGVPVDDTVVVDVRASDRPDLEIADVRIELRLSDGDTEPVPVVTAEDGTVTGRRRPPQQVAVVLGLLGALIVLWVSELIPLFVTSLAVPVVLAVTGVGTAEEVLAPFFDPIIVLFFGGFIMAVAMRRSGLDHRVAVLLVVAAGAGPVRLFSALLALSAFFSMGMSNTAAVAVLLPIALAVTAPLEHRGYRRAVVLGIAYAATIGGVGSAIGTPANQLAIRFIDELTGRQISFVEWFGFGLPLVVSFLPVMGLYLWWIARVQIPRNRFADAQRRARTERGALGPVDADELVVLAVLTTVMALWLTQTWHGVNPGIVALGGAIALFVTGRALPDDLGRISWATLITFGGGLALGLAMVESGTADWLVTQFGGLSDLPTFVGVVAVALFALLLTTVASNTAAAATLIPLAVPLAGLLGVDPVLLVMIVAMATSIDFALVIGTPPTMMAYSTDLFTAADILRIGWPLDLIGVALLVTVVAGFWIAVGLV